MYSYIHDESTTYLKCRMLTLHILQLSLKCRLKAMARGRGRRKDGGRPHLHPELAAPADDTWIDMALVRV